MIERLDNERCCTSEPNVISESIIIKEKITKATLISSDILIKITEKCNVENESDIKENCLLDTLSICNTKLDYLLKRLEEISIKIGG